VVLIILPRILGHDETPQFINYGTDPTVHGLVFAGRGDACNSLIQENRECVTIQPLSTFDGNVIMCQVIFASSGTSIIYIFMFADTVQYSTVDTIL
jgi:hypothetical protein